MKKVWLAICLLFVIVFILAYADYKDDKMQECVMENMGILDYEGALDYCKNSRD
jgi:hypothetical protein